MTINTEPSFTINNSDQDRFRFIVEQAISGTIMTQDLQVQKPVIVRTLSGGAHIEFDVDYRDLSAAGITFWPWGYWVHAEKMIFGEKVIWASVLTKPGQVDKKSGVLHMQGDGFSQYAKGMPWLEDWNPLVVDPFAVVIKIWDHLQSYPNGNLGVTFPTTISGLEMLPGYAFDGSIMNINFFAEYVRQSDKQDCGNVIDALARDIPFDYIENAYWNSNRTAIIKQIVLAPVIDTGESFQPTIGAQQDGLAFVVNENVIEALPNVPAEIDMATDVIIDGWYPGSEYSATFTNEIENQYRRVIMQDDARINSNEIAAAWASRKLTKRQTPPYFSDIVVIMGHPNAPFGTYDVGDRIWVTGFMPWINNGAGGDVRQLHKILAMQVNEEDGTVEIQMYAEGAFNYEPVYYQGSTSGSITISQNNFALAQAIPYGPTIGVS